MLQGSISGLPWGDPDDKLIYISLEEYFDVIYNITFWIKLSDWLIYNNTKKGNNWGSVFSSSTDRNQVALHDAMRFTLRQGLGSLIRLPWIQLFIMKPGIISPQPHSKDTTPHTETETIFLWSCSQGCNYSLYLRRSMTKF